MYRSGLNLLLVALSLLSLSGHVTAWSLASPTLACDRRSKPSVCDAKMELRGGPASKIVVAALTSALLLQGSVMPVHAVSGGVADFGDIAGADMSGGDYSKKDFSGANAKGAKLVKSKLKGARFFKADLTNVDFTGADLTAASLENAKLDGVILTNAVRESKDGTALHSIEPEIKDGTALRFDDDLGSALVPANARAKPNKVLKNAYTGTGLEKVADISGTDWTDAQLRPDVQAKLCDRKDATGTNPKTKADTRSVNSLP